MEDAQLEDFKRKGKKKNKQLKRNRIIPQQSMNLKGQTKSEGKRKKKNPELDDHQLIMRDRERKQAVINNSSNFRSI